jgi:hypothetical protein
LYKLTLIKMKKISKVLFLALSVSLFTAASSHAQIEVKIRPVFPSTRVVVKPRQPSRTSVWVAEGWKVQGNRYVYRPGYWAVPPRGKRAFVAGYWKDTPRRGSVWVKGYWR